MAQQSGRKFILYALSAAVILVAVWIGLRTSQLFRTENAHPATDEAPAQGGAYDKLVMIFPSGNVPKDLPAVQEKLNAYLRDKIGAELEIKPIDMSIWWDRTGLMFASGQQVDLMFTAGWMRFGDEVAKNHFIALDELLDQYGQGIKEILPPSILEAGKLNGHIYGIATNKEFASSKGLVVRADLVQKYGIDLTKIKALEDFGPVFAAIKRNEPDLVPLQVRADRSPFTLLMQYGLFDMLGEGAGALDRSSGSTKVVNIVETPQYLKYAKLMYAWNRAGYLNSDASTTKDNEFEAVKAGKAFAYAESLKPGFDNQASRDVGMPMKTVAITSPYATTADMTSAMFAITRTSRHPQKAMQVLELLFTDPYALNLLDWGIEGEHYVKKSDTIIAYPPGLDARSVGYNLNLPWMFGNQLNSYLWEDEAPGLWEAYRAFNEGAEKSQALGFVFNPDPVKSEIAACNNVDREFSAAINTGVQDPDKIIGMYRSQLRAAGADKVIAEKQRQLDAWLASR
ncbi:ABC transporter substrate-binding protein [Paenibacillus sp. NFR01]|uniref:ABC transporter substrate-binding protein n=1 Tax=Paenibacillus sp. NFR01 TaxID=1566279 RepID=UPI0008C3A876|nr:ABC transporter substrate-binding protein [Paenibacillus sp. NFR01]SEU23670.1 putative aldouronate transport system substrate-binding protein [Paenibacillus sp. NFR01]